MSTKADLTEYYDRLQLSPTARQVAEQIRYGQPIRRARSGKGNVVTRVPSRRMGVTLQTESRYAELLWLYAWEWREEWCEYYDQPYEMVLRYRQVSGKKTGIRHVPDFFLLSRDYAGFVEVKTLDEAVRISESAPGRLNRDEEGQWHSPAGKAAAADLGLGYAVYVPENDDVRFARNVRYIWQYITSTPSNSQQAQIDTLQSEVNSELCTTVKTLVFRYGPEVTHYAIAHHHVYCDLQRDLLTAPHAAYVYPCATLADTSRHCTDPDAKAKPPAVKLTAGCTILWDGAVYEIVNVGEQKYTLQAENQRICTITQAQARSLVEHGRLRPNRESQSVTSPLEHLRQSYSPAHIRRATERAQLLSAYERGEPWARQQLAERTAREWQRRKREAESLHGNSFYGLIDKRHKRGNRCRKIDEQNEALIETSLREDYSSARAGTVRQAYEQYVIRARRSLLAPVNYETYRLAAKRMDPVELTRERSGARAAYQCGPTPPHSDQLDALFPAHGEYAWHVCHLDATKLPLEIRSAVTDEAIGTIWLASLIDAFSRIVLAHTLSFEQPSYRIVMLLLRECVRRWNRLPESIVVDRGAEFSSNYFEAFCARYNIAKVERPPGQPRHGSIIESHFGSTEGSVVRQLTGNRANVTYGRALSATHKPERYASWTADELDDLLEEYLYNVYPNQRHSGIHDIPRRAFESSIASAGTANNAFIPWDMEFYVETLPEVPGYTRLIRRGQIVVNHLVYQPLAIAVHRYNGQRVQVRSDPTDTSHVYAYIHADWRECVTTSSVLRHAREMDVRHVHLEVAARAWNTGRQYRRVSNAWLNFVEDIRYREKKAREVAAISDQSIASRGGNYEEQSETTGDCADYEQKAEAIPVKTRHVRKSAHLGLDYQDDADEDNS